MKLKRTRKATITLMLTLLITMTMFTSVAFAQTGGLNGIGQQQTPPYTQNEVTTQQEQQTTPPVQSTTPDTSTGQSESNASAVGNLWQGVGVDAEASQKASAMMHPIAQVVNVIFAVILSIATIGMFLITSLDLLYIAVPPVRNLLYKGGAQQSSGGMGMGMGMGGGYGGGMGGGYGGGMGGGMMGGQPQQSSGVLSQFISDEAVAAVQESQPQQGGGMGMGMGGFGGMGGQQQQKTKSVVMSYLKKRIMFLAMFGICAVLLSTTIFTDLGVQIGTWVLNRLTGIEQNFPS